MSSIANNPIAAAATNILSDQRQAASSAMLQTALKSEQRSADLLVAALENGANVKPSSSTAPGVGVALDRKV